MTNMPDWVLNLTGYSSGQFDSGAGTWKIIFSRQTDSWVIDIDLVLNGKTGGGYRSLYLLGNQPPYAIFDWVGDPDSADAMIFEKR